MTTSLVTAVLATFAIQFFGTQSTPPAVIATAGLLPAAKDH